MKRGGRVLILGGGFAGVYTALALQEELRGLQARVAIVNRENFFVYYPLLVETISGEIDTEHVLNPIRQIAPDAKLYVGDVVKIDLDGSKVEIRHGLYGHTQTPRTLYYDHLVLALGGVPSTSRIPGLADYAFDVQRLPTAFALRNHIIDTLEQAAIERDPQIRQRLLTYVVIGGGSTGVEVAAQLQAMLDDAIRFYPGIALSEVRVIIVEYGPQLLGHLPDELIEFAQRSLEQHGVIVRTGTAVERIERHKVFLSGGETIASSTVIGSVGVDVNPLIRDLTGPHDKRGRLIASDALLVGDRRNVWAIGDNARVYDPHTGEPYPQTAQHAVREARIVAHNIAATMRGEPLQTMDYKTRGQLIALGKRNAIAQVFGHQFEGFSAWWLWRTYYLAQMPLWEKRLRVMFSWTIDLVFPPILVQLKVGQPAPMAKQSDEGSGKQAAGS